MIFLIGYMGSGKSTTGKKLSTLLNIPFIDLDNAIEENLRLTIPTIFNQFGEAFFRTKEAEILRSTSIYKHAIISTGGGTPCFHNNMQWMNDHGITIYLEMPPKALYSRLKNAKKRRPLFDNQQDPETFILSHLKEREKYYLQAKIITNGLSLDIAALSHEIEKLSPQPE